MRNRVESIITRAILSIVCFCYAFQIRLQLLVLLIFCCCVLIEMAMFRNRYLPLPHGVLEIIAAMAFFAEYLLFNFHSTSHAGLEGRYHQILVLLVGLCIISTVLAATFPKSFVVDLLGGITFTLKGIWFYQVAFTLYGPTMPTGCDIKDHEIACESKEFEMRGQSVLTMVLYQFGFAASRCGHPSLYHSNNESQDKSSIKTVWLYIYKPSEYRLGG